MYIDLNKHKCALLVEQAKQQFSVTEMVRFISQHKFLMLMPCKVMLDKYFKPLY